MRRSARKSVLAQLDYAHPVFDLGAIDAQRRLHIIQGASAPGTAARGPATVSTRTVCEVRPGRGARVAEALAQRELRARRGDGGGRGPGQPPGARPAIGHGAPRAAAAGGARVRLSHRLPDAADARALADGDGALARNRRARWLRATADHGDGGPDALAWVEAMLARAGVDDADGEIWLQTYPRVAGFVFKPVSFWYCHRADGRLRAVVAEVNNTFGERHCYLLDEAGLAWGRTVTARKVFHVSPFCEVEGGTYRFRTARRRAHRRVELDDRRPAARHQRQRPARTAHRRAGPRHAAALMPMLTLGVVARIHWQALRLWLKRVPWYQTARGSVRVASTMTLERPPDEQPAAALASACSPSLARPISTGPRRLRPGAPNARDRAAACIAARRSTGRTPSRQYRSATAVRSARRRRRSCRCTTVGVRARAAQRRHRFAEAYVDGLWTTPDLRALLACVMRQRAVLDDVVYGSFGARCCTAWRTWLNRNTRAGSRRTSTPTTTWATRSTNCGSTRP